MGDYRWRLVDTPMMQPRDTKKIVFADWGPWSDNLDTTLSMGLWLENRGRQVWIEVSDKTWLNTQGLASEGPPQHFKRPTKGGY